MATELDLYRLHQEQRRLDQVYRFWTAPAENPSDPRRQLADSAEREAAYRLALGGYDVALTREYGARFDLLVESALRVEVKASTWRPAPGNRGRYQALWHNKADLLLWLLADVGRWVIIPADHLGQRRNLAIWSVQRPMVKLPGRLAHR